MPQKTLLQEAIASPGKRPLIFIFMIGLLLAVAANGLSTLILEVLGTWLEKTFEIKKVFWQMSIVTSIILLLTFWLMRAGELIRKLFSRSTLAIRDANVIAMNETTFEGLIVFVSSGNNPPAKIAIEHHWQNRKGKLEHCWLISTEESLSNAVQISKDFIEAGVPSSTFHLGNEYLMANVESLKHQISLVITKQQMNDPNYIHNLINCIYEDGAEKFGMDESEIIADYTGGSKSATAGIVLAGASPHRRLQYIVSDFDPVSKTVSNSEVNEVRISYSVKPISS
jgi:hypothetical protein